MTASFQGWFREWTTEKVLPFSPFYAEAMGREKQENLCYHF